MKANFEATASVSVQNEAQNLVEFCVFRYLARSGADVHPGLWVNIPQSFLGLRVPFYQEKICTYSMYFAYQFLPNRWISITSRS